MNRPAQPRSAFTLIEVIAIILVVGIGLMGVVGVVQYGQKRALRTQSRVLAWETALSVAYDPQPLLDPQQQADWYFSVDNDFDDPTYEIIARGFINGLYVDRAETSQPGDIVGKTTVDVSSQQVTARSSLVTVSVYDGYRGELLCRYNVRLLRQAGYDDAVFGARP